MILRFLYRLVCKIAYLIIPFIAKILILFKIQNRVINQLINLRLKANSNKNYEKFVSKLLLDEKIVALDIGAQGGFNENIFPKKYDKFFLPILVEPIKDEADKLKKENYLVIPKGIWSNNCNKKLYIAKKRLGSSSMYKLNKNAFPLYDIKEKNFPLFETYNEIDVNCSTINESLENLNIKKLDFLKVDTQGAELEIFKGLGKYSPLLIKTEAQIIPMYEKVPDWSELLNFLYKLNYMTCEWEEIGTHATHTPAEIDMLFIPNYLNDRGKELIISRKREFISLMLIFGQIKLLQIISAKLNFSEKNEIQKLKDKFFH